MQWENAVIQAKHLGGFYLWIFVFWHIYFLFCLVVSILANPTPVISSGLPPFIHGPKKTNPTTTNLLRTLLCFLSLRCFTLVSRVVFCSCSGPLWISCLAVSDSIPNHFEKRRDWNIRYSLTLLDESGANMSTVQRWKAFFRATQHFVVHGVVFT